MEKKKRRAVTTYLPGRPSQQPRLEPIAPAPESKKRRLTPASHNMEVETPTITLDSESDLEPQKPQRSTAAIKGEPLDTELMSKTVFRVSSGNHADRGPIHVPYISCPTLNKHFTELISERQVPEHLARKVKNITATCIWSGEQFGIRKCRLQDWLFFSEHLREVWITKAGKSREKCKVDIMIHVDE